MALKFRFSISGWHNVSDEDAVMYATFTAEQKAQYLGEVKESLREMMMVEAIDSETPFELNVEYAEVSE